MLKSPTNAKQKQITINHLRLRIKHVGKLEALCCKWLYRSSCSQNCCNGKKKTVTNLRTRYACLQFKLLFSIYSLKSQNSSITAAVLTQQKTEDRNAKLVTRHYLWQRNVKWINIENGTDELQLKLKSEEISLYTAFVSLSIGTFKHRYVHLHMRLKILSELYASSTLNFFPPRRSQAAAPDGAAPPHLTSQEVTDVFENSQNVL